MYFIRLSNILLLVCVQLYLSLCKVEANNSSVLSTKNKNSDDQRDEISIPINKV